MQMCECICRYKNNDNKYTAYDLRLDTGNIITLPYAKLESALRVGTLRCTNACLAPDNTLYVEANVPVVSKKLTSSIAKEVDAFVQAVYIRFKLAGVYTNLEVAFDSFLDVKRQQGIVFSPLEQYCIYEYMNNSRDWDIFTAYVEQEGSIILTSTRVTEGIFILRCFVTEVHGVQNQFGSPFNVRLGRLKVINQSPVQDMRGLFSSLEAEYLDLSEFTTNMVANMSYMFYFCNVKELDLGSFNTSNVLMMVRMFAGCARLERLNLCSFDTRTVTSMLGMFFGCASLRNLDLRSFNTSRVTNMQAMFHSCDIRTWLLPDLDTSNVTDMTEMFRESIIIGTEMCGFNTSKVTSFQRMFSDCKFQNGKCNLSNFDTRRATMFSSMFRDCATLIEVDLSSFMFAKSADITGMFQNCEKLQHLELNLGYSEFTYASDFCSGCRILKTLTLRGVDFARIKYMDNAIILCDSLRILNLECRNLNKRVIRDFVGYRLKSLQAVNLKGSEPLSIKLAKNYVREEKLYMDIIS